MPDATQKAARDGERCAPQRRMNRCLNSCVARFVRSGLPLAIALAACCAAQAQNSSQQGAGNGSSGMPGSATRSGFGRPNMGTLPGDDDNYDPVMAERRLRALNIERQKQMVSDATKLLKLAQELNSEVASANAGGFTPDQLRKIGEIEKLARSVRERMSSAVGETPAVLPPPTLTYPIH
jgi:hypothetical protein